MSWFSDLFRCRKLDVIPSDYTHTEANISGEYNVYWKIDDEGIFLWHGINHYWQEMKCINKHEFLKKLESSE